MNKLSGVYRIQCLPTGDFYVGSSVDVQARIRTHFRTLRASKHRSYKFQRCFNQWGESTFIWGLVEQTTSDFLLVSEQQYLDLWKPSLNISEMASNPMLGRKHTEETKSKMANSAKGNVGRRGLALSADHRQNISKALKNRGIYWSEKLWANRTKQYGENNHFFGKQHSDGAKHAISLANTGKFVGAKSVRAKAVLQMTISGDFIKEWPSQADAAKELSLNRSKITSACSGKRATCGGFKWKYK